MNRRRVLVVGGGIAGASLAYELARDHEVTLLEAEPTLGFHTTGRSAATYLESIGPAVWRALTRASRGFLSVPPEHFDLPLLRPRPMLVYARPGRLSALEDRYVGLSEMSEDDVQLLTARQTAEICPVLREDLICGSILEVGAQEVDVPALLAGYVRGLRYRGGEILTGARTVHFRSTAEGWTVTTGNGRRHRADIVVNAAGAWLDVVGQSAGALPVGVTPLRRTIFLAASPHPGLTRDLPLFGDLDSGVYVRPQDELLLCSPGDETPWPAEDVRADEVAMAEALREIAEVTTFGRLEVRSRRAGLRTSVPDGRPVVGFDPDVEGLFWFGGQGGFGIQAAPALARSAANLVRGLDLPRDVAHLGVRREDLDRDRPSLNAATHPPGEHR